MQASIGCMVSENYLAEFACCAGELNFPAIVAYTLLCSIRYGRKKNHGR